MKPGVQTSWPCSPSIRPSQPPSLACNVGSSYGEHESRLKMLTGVRPTIWRNQASGGQSAHMGKG
jgi:hypothetical protein